MLSRDLQQLFEQLALRPEFREWVEGELSTEMKVLKQAISMEQLYRAQGAVRVWETIKGSLERKPKGS